VSERELFLFHLVYKINATQHAIQNQEKRFRPTGYELKNME